MTSWKSRQVGCLPKQSQRIRASNYANLLQIIYGLRLEKTLFSQFSIYLLFGSKYLTRKIAFFPGQFAHQQIWKKNAAEHKVGCDQCDQMAVLFIQYLAVGINEICPKA